MTTQPEYKCPHCGERVCYCCPECGKHVLIGHANDCPLANYIETGSDDVCAECRRRVMVEDHAISCTRDPNHCQRVREQHDKAINFLWMFLVLALLGAAFVAGIMMWVAMFFVHGA